MPTLLPHLDADQGQSCSPCPDVLANRLTMRRRLLHKEPLEHETGGESSTQRALAEEHLDNRYQTELCKAMTN